MKKYHVTITSGIFVLRKEYRLECIDFEELKTEILKRFGNLEGTSQAQREKALVKTLIKNSTDPDMLRKSLYNTQWSVIVREV